MVLESTMICVDDSDYMRNGDFVPTRMAAVQDAVNIVCHTKTRANPENNVGLLTLASSKVLTTLTTDSAKLMSKMLACQPAGDLQLMSGLRKAHLALKHRQGKNHKMRIVVFVGSPLDNPDAAEWIRLAKRMKKEKVNVDIIAFGDGSCDVLQQFVETLNGRDGSGSHLIVVPQGTSSLSDALMASPILQSEDGMPMPGGGYEFGVDPNDDPELALALRVSMEEQRTRQEATGISGSQAAVAAPGTSEEQMLERALAISREQEAAAAAGGAHAEAVVDFAAMTEEEQIAYAMQMSMQDSQPTEGMAATASASVPMESEPVEEAVIEKMELDEPGPAPVDPAAAAAVLEDPNFLQSVLEGLPARVSNAAGGTAPTGQEPTNPGGSTTPNTQSDKEKEKPAPKK